MFARASQLFASTRTAARVAEAVDGAFSSFLRSQSTRARQRGGRSQPSAEERVEWLRQAAAAYPQDPTEGFLRSSARAIAPLGPEVRTLPGGGAVQDLRWSSDYEPYLAELAERYGRHEPNRQAAVRLWRHSTATERPVAVLLHAYMMGSYWLDERVWPLTFLYRDLGLDVALFVLPLHGVRADRGRRGAPSFPSRDPRVTNEGFRHVVGDLVDFVAWLRERGHRAIGVMGMSLGGYTSALLATVDPSLAFVVPIVPLASLAGFACAHGQTTAVSGEWLELEHQGLDAVHQVVSPLVRPPLVESQRALVFQGAADRVTPAGHPQLLADYFSAPVDTWPGGHLLPFGRSQSFRRLGEWLSDLGVTHPP